MRRSKALQIKLIGLVLGMVTALGAGGVVGASHASAAPASIREYCNWAVCMQVEGGSGGWYKVRGYLRATHLGPTYMDGHFDFWGPGLNKHSSDAKWQINQPTIWYAGQGVGTVCMEGWDKSKGVWDSFGLPCGSTH